MVTPPTQLNGWDTALQWGNGITGLVGAYGSVIGAKAAKDNAEANREQLAFNRKATTAGIQSNLDQAAMRKYTGQGMSIAEAEKLAALEVQKKMAQYRLV